jgi:molybdate transport system substrate-binding protein
MTVFISRPNAAAAIAVALLILSTAPTAAGLIPQRQLLVFAAASLQTVLDDLIPDIERDQGQRIRTSYAASSILARQIENGAPADVFISADLEWMDYLADRQLVQPRSRVILASNRLVLIAPAGAPVRLRVAPRFPLAAAIGPNRLAMADPAAVPAGRYARAALTSLGVWSSVADRLARSENVRAALVLVSRGEAPLGIVYRTDALADRGVTIVDTFPAGSHPPIVYPAALTKTAAPGAAHVLARLGDAGAKAAFARHGFLVDGVD